jgi:hypothetical protein
MIWCILVRVTTATVQVIGKMTIEIIITTLHSPWVTSFKPGDKATLLYKAFREGWMAQLADGTIAYVGSSNEHFKEI